MSKDYQFGQIRIKTRLISDDDSKSADACPNEDIKQCPIKKMIMAKTFMIISKKLRDFYCVYNPRNSSSGWVSEKNIIIVPAKEIQTSNWVGEWVDGRNFIEIKEKELHVSGQALWVGAMPGGVNTGELDFIGHPNKDKLRDLAKEQYDCAVELINLGSYLVVRDNGSCGGLNVRFNGVFRRK